MKYLKNIILIILAFIWNWLKTQYNKNPQILWIPIGIILWVVSIPLIRLADPTAAVFDAGIFQIPIYATIIYIISLFIAWYTVRILFGTIYSYLKTDYKKDFNKLPSWAKIVISLSVFFLLLFALIGLMGVL